PLLIGLGDDGLIRFWETEAYTETYLFKCDDGRGQFINIELSPNGHFLACGNYQSVRIYRLLA
ncbi:MAG: hypothetical protein AAFX40_02740, partial [Cyanobacteria bacterium J06639_1]